MPPVLRPVRAFRCIRKAVCRQIANAAGSASSDSANYRQVEVLKSEGYLSGRMQVRASAAVVFKNSISSIHCRGMTSLASDILQACAQLWIHFNLSLLPLLDG